MASGLKWQFGFGWGSVSLFVALVVMSLASSGIVRWIAIVITILAFAFLVVQYKNWNTKGWRQVHGRAMHRFVFGSAEHRYHDTGRPLAVPDNAPQGAFAEFERSMIRSRVNLGLARARAIPI
jgi:hypothetical protein